MCRLHEEMSRKVYSIDLTVLIPRKLYRNLSPILLIFAQGNFSFGVVLVSYYLDNLIYDSFHGLECDHCKEGKPC